MRVAIVTESFLPHVNGVTNSVLRVVEHLARRGHEARVLAPQPAAPRWCGDARVVHLPSLPLPGYPEVRLSLATAHRIGRALADFEPDIVHLASPFLLGGPTLRAAARLQLPVVGVFQTDVAGFLAHYRLGPAAMTAWRRLRRIHQACDLTLAPSNATAAMLVAQDVPRVRLWPRGVDTRRFSPVWRDPGLRRALAPNGEVLVGYVGRLAAEKRLDDLAVLHRLPGLRLVLVGDGPMRARLERLLPGAAFLGYRTGDELSSAVASLDIFVMPGQRETFCQAAQEALASGVPVVAPGAGGLRDLVRSSHTGWLYAPGDLSQMRQHVLDLAGDAGKRRAFGHAARQSVLPRTWESIGDELLRQYSLILSPDTAR